MNKKKILFMGRKKYAARMLEWTYKQGHEIVSVVTDSHFHNSPTKLMAESLNIPVISLEEAEKMIRANPNCVDIVVSYLYWRKLKEPIISATKLGCINFHPAILPDWKGVGGYNNAILNKLSEWGASAHFVDESIDTGDIIKVFKFSFDFRNETAQSLEEKTMKIQCDLYKSVMTDILDMEEKYSKTIPNIGGKYTSYKELLGNMKIDPEKDDVKLKTHAFWFPPYHGAYVEINGEIYTLVDEFILKQLKKDDQTANNC